MKRLPLILLLLCAVSLAAAQALTDRQRIQSALDALAPLESTLTGSNLTNLRNAVTRLKSLQAALPADPVPTPTPTPTPEYVSKSEFRTAIDGILARLGILEKAPTPTPTPDPTPTPTPTPELCGNGVDDDKDGQIDEGCIPPPPPSTEANAYFDALKARPDLQVAYSLRSQAEIDKFRHPNEVKVNYDPQLNAAKWQWIKDDESADNLRMPIVLDRPATGSRKILIISDHRWDTGWFTEFKQPDGRWMGGWKWLQVTSGKAADNPEQRISFEPQMRGIGEWAAEHPNESDVLALFSVREYMGVRGTTTSSAAVGCGVDFGEVVAINQKMGCFKARANRWTRAFIEIEVTAGDEFVKASFWLADEEQDAVNIFRNAEVRMYNPIREFWYEYDTSRPERLGGPMAAWGKNVVVLKDVADPLPLLQKPVK